MWFTIALCATVAGLLHRYLVWNYKYWSQRGVPGPGATLVAGSFPQSFLQRKNMVYEADEVYRKYRGTAPYVGFYTSRLPALMFLDPKYIKEALTTDFKSFHDNNVGVKVDKDTDPLLGRNPFLLCGDEWKEKRAEITPAFTNNKMKTMFPIMQHVCTKLTEHVHDELAKKPDGFDAKELAAKYTADVVANCIYGIDSMALSGKRSMMREMGSAIFNFDAITFIYFAVVQFLPCINRVYSMPFVAKRVEKFFEQLTADAIKLRLESGVQRDDYLNYLLQLRERKPMADIDLTAHTMTFFVDGFETSSAVIANVLLQIAQHEAVQTRLRAEIESAASDGASVTYEEINDMEYLDQVVNETLRLTPAIGFLSKTCTESTVLRDFAGHSVRIEEGTAIMVPVYSIHRDAEYYPEPEVFDPDRFAAENGGLKRFRDEGVFLTFGDGPRICLGMRFALLQVKSAVVEIVRNYAVSVNAKMQFPIVFDPKNFLLMPIGGIWLDMEPLKKGN